MLLPSLMKINLNGNAHILWEVEELKKRMKIISPKLDIVYWESVSLCSVIYFSDIFFSLIPQ
jgi:hypothetical protein